MHELVELDGLLDKGLRPAREEFVSRRSQTGLHYNRHRYDDPATGRFISKDLIDLAGGLNAVAADRDIQVKVDESNRRNRRIIEGR
ncbi:RHS repeat-associated core domain-containing protein [Caballeronia sp. ATUFL_F1_KS4A]|uniref:RHS repeat-associated core domain-containing protein n=1 Tax=Caballeronia sp. ATUFL_F1_KS4A TaxID=2921768 RepID=UPI0032ECB6EB